MIDIKWRLEYDKMWLKFKDKEFSSENAFEVIFGRKKFTSKQIKYGSKLINLIEDNGLAVHRRADYDQRVRLYRLLNPEKASNARAIYKNIFERKKAFTLSAMVKEANISAGWNYLYIKDTAIWFWTNQYRSSDVRHISVFKEDSDGWVSLFKLFGSAVVADGTAVTESKETGEVVSLHTDLDSRRHKRGKNHFQSAEHTILEAFKDNDILSALAVLTVQKNKLDWNLLIDIAKNRGLINTLGFSLDCMNLESGKGVFSKKMIDRIEKHRQKEFETIKGLEQSKEMNLAYKPLEKKWNVRCSQAAAFSKAALDLVR